MRETARDLKPRIKQLSLFLPNRLGALGAVVARLDEEQVKLCAISILDAADHAVVRMIVNRPAPAKGALLGAGYTVFETDLLGVALPGRGDDEFGILKVLQALLVAEVNVCYVYSLIVQVDGRPVIALNVDDAEAASHVLTKAGLALIGQEEIGWEEPP